jgi:small subunit ribosomal protein S1
VEIPEQVVQVGSDVMVKVIDIDLERRRISLSLKQANEGFLEGEEHFDPTLYGMAAEYDENGNYKYPEGFDPETGEWLPGFEAQRDEWERQYAAARTRWEAHTRQVQNARAVAEEASAGGESAGGSTGGSAGGSAGGAARKASEPAKRRPEPAGTLATDEALAALKEKLAGN